MTANVESMMSVREVPWHGIGNVLQEAPDAKAALLAAGLDWKVSKEMLFWRGEPIFGHYALARNTGDDSKDLLGYCGKDYRIFQNSESFELMEDIVGQDLKYETAGSLDNGKRIFITTKWQQKWSVADDPLDLYLLLSNSHTGHDPVRMAVTPVRVVCQNTLTAALGAAIRSWTVRHCRNADEKLEEARTALMLSNKYMSSFVEFGNRSADKILSANQIESIVEDLFPTDKGESQRQKTIRENKILSFESCYNADDLKQYRNTAWGLLNAVSDYETHQTVTGSKLMKKLLDDKLILFNKTVNLISAI